MKQVIRDEAGHYLIKGKLLTGTKETATVYSNEDDLLDALDGLDSLGVTGFIEDLPEDSVDTASLQDQIDAIIEKLVGLRDAVAKVKRGKKYAPTAEQQDRIDNQGFSFGIRFIRAKKLSEVKGPSGWEPSPGLTVVSARTFGTKEEAEVHAKRFQKIEGHFGYEVIEVDGGPNAWVNEKTGKTNPVIGLKRTNR